MQQGLSHDRADETLEVKTRWFRPIPLREHWSLCASSPS